MVEKKRLSQNLPQPLLVSLKTGLLLSSGKRPGRKRYRLSEGTPASFAMLIFLEYKLLLERIALLLHQSRSAPLITHNQGSHLLVKADGQSFFSYLIYLPNKE